MLKQYLDAKASHPDCLVLFRMGDFYEVFFEDARIAAEALDLTLTARGKEQGEPIPMAGVPHHAAEGYIRRLVEKGFRVALCEQLEDPAAAKGIVKRGVVRVITPGVQTDSGQLDAAHNNYLVSVAIGASDGAQTYGLCALDVSTGDFRALEVLSLEAVTLELERLRPAELLVADEQLGALDSVLQRRTVSRRPAFALQLERVLRQAAVSPLAADVRGQPFMSLGSADVRRRIEALDQNLFRDRVAVERAIALVLDYVIGTQGGISPILAPLQVIRGDEFLVLDPDSAANLEVFETLMGGQRRGSLVSVIDQTVTAAGARRLRTWLAYPLRRVDRIRVRQAAVSELVERATSRAQLREELRETRDIQRLASRVATGQGNPRDLVALAASLSRVPRIQALLEGLGAPLLAQLLATLDPCDDVVADVRSILVDEPPVAVNDGGLVRQGCSPELDALIERTTHGKEWLLRFEAEQRQRTGIGSLKVRYNKVFGYYIEITRSNLESVPDDYIRKQTIAGGERYYTVELKEFEDDLLHAQDRRAALEQAIYEALRRRVCERIDAARRTSESLAELDVLAGLAELAHRRRYTSPEVVETPGISIRDGRHPVVEQMVEGERFVANDTDVSPDQRLLVITGPNMGGKSTIIRQVALIVLLAQIGSHVPAGAATVGVVDQIFSRVGASDNLAKGQSTFMVEMAETAQILKRATDRSLVILDEIGRGTATWDGLSIAWAVAEHLHDDVQALTLFATHYHEMTDIARQRPTARNFSVAAREWNDQIIFLHRLVEGPANRSYGIQVARLAGIPDAVVRRARGMLEALESGAPREVVEAAPSTAPLAVNTDSGQLALFESAVRPPIADPLLDEMAAVKVESTTPLEALNLIAKWQRKLRRNRHSG